ncbi:hypothetical protein O3P69_020033 [Scylla paramamosain]|uniref:Sodium/solute symporter n=1 Tax=Scylla paramamosain TaxID=85552 RepID=A0AAW0TN85_SCYPA
MSAMSTSVTEAGTEATLDLTETMIEEDSIKFKVADWTVFCLMLVASVCIGIVSALKDRRKATIQEYLLGGGNMPPLAVALSLMGGWVSAISILGNPTEIYFYGTQVATSLIGCVPGAIVVNKIILPIFYNLKIVSVNEYLERRYRSVALRKVCTFISLLNLFLYMGMCLYAPSLALSTVTSLSTFTTMAIMGAIVSFYITIGGVKAVVYTDVLQTLLMFGGVLAVVVLGCSEVGGVKEVWAIAERGDRLEFFNTDPSPYVRHSVLSTFFMGFFLVINTIGVSQSSYQRFASVKTLKTAKRLVYFFLIALWCLWIVFFFSGLVAYAIYSTCDPLTSGKINKADQIIPFLVTDKLGHVPAMAGIFVAAVYGGVLSTLSTCGNSTVCMVWEDFLKPLPFFSGFSDSSATRVMKILSSLTGVISVALGMLMSNLGNIFHVIFSISGALSGPITGVFLVGILMPWVDGKSVISGLLVSFCFNVWLVVGKFLKGAGAPTQLPLSIVGCASHLNATLDSLASSTLSSPTLASTTVDQVEESIYDISYCYNSFIGVTITMVVSTLVSLVNGPKRPEIDDRLVNPTCDRVYRKAWKRYLIWRKGKMAQQIQKEQENNAESMTMLHKVKSGPDTSGNP